MVHRDLELSRLTGAPIHLLHLSTAGSVELVRRAKAEGVRVTAEVTPHHLQPHRRAASRLRPACSRSTRRCARRPMSRRSSRASSTGRSTPSPPTTPRTRPLTRSSRSTRRLRGWSGWRRRSGCCLPILIARRDERHRRRRGAGRGSRRRSPASPSATAGRSPPGDRPTSSCSTPTSRGRSFPPSSPAAATTPRTPAVSCAAWSATRCSTGSRRSSTGWRADE